jgi:putative transcriptional regulator
MLNENIKVARKAKGLSQEELAIKLNVVRQTVSKWERGLSVPDSEMLISISDALEMPVSALLGETVEESASDDINALSEKLEVINLRFARQKALRRRIIHWAFIILCALIVIVFALMVFAKSPYLGWDFANPETAVFGSLLHAFEWGFVRLAPFAFVGTLVGAVMTRRRS